MLIAVVTGVLTILIGGAIIVALAPRQSAALLRRICLRLLVHVGTFLTGVVCAGGIIISALGGKNRGKALELMFANDLEIVRDYFEWGLEGATLRQAVRLMNAERDGGGVLSVRPDGAVLLHYKGHTVELRTDDNMVEYGTLEAGR